MRLVFKAEYAVAHGIFTVQRPSRAYRWEDVLSEATLLYDEARLYDGDCLSVSYYNAEFDTPERRWYGVPLDWLRMETVDAATT